METLKEINFKRIINLDIGSPEGYTYSEWHRDTAAKPRIIGCCVSCEEKDLNTWSAPEGADPSEFRLTVVSTGTQSSDLFQASPEQHDTSTSGWHQDPIMFVFESPSKAWNEGVEVKTSGYVKKAAPPFYWVPRNASPGGFPVNFRGRVYGEFVLSAANTFRLANVYMTNLVKCSLNNANGAFKNLDFFKDQCVANCIEEILSREVEAFQPKIIFAMGARVENWLNKCIGGRTPIYQLPHPARCQQGFRDDYFRTVYFWTIARALYKAGILAIPELEDLLFFFLDGFPDGRDPRIGCK